MNPARGLVVVDVEGVLLPRKAALLLRLSRVTGVKWLLRNIARGLAYQFRLIGLKKAVEGLYRDLIGISMADILSCYDFEKIEKRVKELRKLADSGFRVVLISSGAPHAIVEKLAQEAKAEAGYGIGVLLDEKERIIGIDDLTSADERGKVALVTRHIRRGERVIVVADDRNNLQLLEVSDLFVGFNPDPMVAAKADVIVEGDDLTPVVDYLLHGTIPRRKTAGLLFRKALHIAGALIVLIYAISKSLAQALIILAAMVYALAESLRTMGAYVPIISSMTRLAARGWELEGPALSPLAYAISLAIAAAAPPPYSVTAIITLTVGDGVAGLLNSLIKGHPYPHTRTKKVEGTVIGFAAAALLSSTVADPLLAVASAAAGMVVEAIVTFEDDLAVTLASLTPLFAALLGYRPPA